MAKGDVKQVRYRRRSGGMLLSSYINWDVDARRRSKVWYNRVRDAPDASVYVDNLRDVDLYDMWIRTKTTSRYGDYDWYRIRKLLGKEATERAMGRIKRQTERRAKESKKWQAEYDAQSKIEEAERKAKLVAETIEYRQAAALTAGLLRSDFHQAFTYREKYGRENGDWLDDPVDAYTSGCGFGEEVRERSGVKLQVTLSLDVSNSMWHNGVAADALRAFITFGSALDDLRQQFPDSLYVQGFVFALGANGKRAGCVNSLWETRSFASDNDGDDTRLGEYDKLRESVNVEPAWAGQDTWITPLFHAIKKWEDENSDPGAIRLDLIITDGVLEHRNDIRDANRVQEHRDGALQSVFLNFLPEDEWVDVTMPLRCIQYPIQKDNLAGLLRQLLAEFTSVYV